MDADTFLASFKNNIIDLDSHNYIPTGDTPFSYCFAASRAFIKKHIEVLGYSLVREKVFLLREQFWLIPQKNHG